MYATAAELLAETDPDLVAGLSGTDEPDEAAIEKALESASGTIDSYLSGRYTLPLSDPPIQLRTIAIDIALYQMMRLRSQGDIEDARKRYEDAIDFLKMVAKGVVNIGPATDPESSEPEVDSGIDSFSAPRIMKCLDY